MVKIMDDVAQTTKWTCCPHIAMGEHRPKLTNTTTLIELDAGHLLALCPLCWQIIEGRALRNVIAEAATNAFRHRPGW
jgi:hypothetical protein